jgi:broad specificity phosphatase PhoE
MTKKLFILRHGQTDFNKIGVVQGSGIDAPLNETGRKQAESFFKGYADIPFDVVYTSALQRTLLTSTLGHPKLKLEHFGQFLLAFIKKKCFLNLLTC